MEKKMAARENTKGKVQQTIASLPPESLEELASFLEFLKFKYQVAGSRKVVALGGLWKNLNLDVTDTDVRALRQQVTTQLLSKV